MRKSEITPPPKFICHISLDAEDCVLKEGESLENFTQRLELLIQDITQRAEGAEVLIITSGSNRQFIGIDVYNSFSHNNGVFLHALLHIEKAVRSRLKGSRTKLVLDTVMLQDSFTSAPSGSTAKKILKASGDLGEKIPSYPPEYKKQSVFNQLVGDFFKDILFDNKILLHYAVHHKLRKDYPNFQIRSAIYDDRTDIFEGVTAFNKEIPFFPTDCEVDFCKYTNRGAQPVIKYQYVSTTGDKNDPNYEATILALSQVPNFSKRESEHVSIIDTAKIGPIVEIMKQRSDSPHDQKEIIKDKKLLLDIYIKKFKPCLNLKEITDAIMPRSKGC